MNNITLNWVTHCVQKIKGIEKREDTKTSSQAANLGNATNEKPGAYIQGYTELHVCCLVLCEYEKQLRA
jgi:hypothetical protein